MSDINSQIAERIKELQQQNEERAKEQASAEKAVEDGSFDSKPVVEQVQRKKKKKKKSVSVQNKPFEEGKLADDGPTGDMTKDGARAGLDEAFEEMESLFNTSGAEEKHKKTRSVPKRDVEEAVEEAEKPKLKSARERGHHTTVHRVVRYVDAGGKALVSFCLIDTETGEVKPVGKYCMVGRSAQMDIVIHNRYISGEHARIYEKDGDYYIQDLDSTNGTKVNGERIYEETKIEPGDRITLAAKDFVFDVTG